MKLKSLKLNNFRRFYGSQEIVFSTNKNKKITIIHAENGVGKTNILRAVHWVMYGELIAMKKKDKAGIVNTTHLINVKQEKIPFDCHVILNVEHGGQTYELKRVLKSDQKNSDLKIWYGSDEKRVSSTDLKETVERILPQGLARYFFFQGESLETMTESEDDIGAAISNIQGIDDATHVLEFLKKSHKTLSDKFTKKTNLDAQSRVIKDKIDKLLVSIERREKKLVELKKDRKTYNSNVELGYKALQQMSTALLSAKLKEREDKAKLLPKKQNDLKKHLATKNRCVQDFYSGVMTAKVAEIASEIKEDLKLAGKFPHKLSLDLITKIFKDKKCICNRCVEIGTEEWRAIEEWNKEAGDPTLTDRFSSIGNELPESKRLSKMFKENMANHESITNDYETEIKNLKNEIQELDAWLEDKDPKKAKKFEDLVKTNEKQRNKTNDEIDTLDELLKGELKELAPLQKNYEDLITKSSMPESEKNRITFLKSAFNRLQNIIDSQQNEAKEYIKNDLQELIFKHANKYFEIEFDENFVPSLKEKNIGGETTYADESKGELLLLNIAFVTSMIAYSRYRNELSQLDAFAIHGLEAPLLLDAPFGDAQTYKKNIADILVNSPAEQVIIMCAKGFYEGSFHETVCEDVGSRYLIENHAIQSEIKKEFEHAHENSIININGKNHTQLFEEKDFGWSEVKKING